MARGETSRKMRQRKSWRKYKARIKRKVEEHHKYRTGNGSAKAATTTRTANHVLPDTGQQGMSPETYHNLPRATYSDGECYFGSCGHYPNRETTITLTNGDRVGLVTCSKCKRNMRPYLR